ncbi:MAG TPA: bifunctional 2-polyprenyl-6-hydroxyphenol methylase/3-demethylubiquinol 3-O-methyltransferase UbiG [Rhizomicrobium sp.]|jgi:2-polyprenyl-6-hydroxyphenyl methylase/3-demethylubiquinone-9 3-methyltransferase
METAGTSIDPGEIAKFAALAQEWWDPAGPFAPLHKFNPVRLKFIRDTAAAHFEREARGLRPFEGLTLLDIGCGGGLIAEPMARLGFAVMGVDAGGETVKIASAHAAKSGLVIDYRRVGPEELAAEKLAFDLVLCLEVVEHTGDPGEFIASCAKLVKPGGLLFVGTINKTLKSFALAKLAAEYILRWVPYGTHDWNRFVEPRRLQAMLEDDGLRVLKTQGFMFDPLSWDWRLSGDTDVNYIVAAVRD